MFEAYLLTEKRVSRNTLSAYRSDLRQLQLFLEEQDTVIEDATPDNLTAYIHHLKKEQGIEARSIARKIASIRAFFGYLHERFNKPHVAQELHIPKIKKSLPTFLHEEEIGQLLHRADEATSPPTIRNKTMLYLLYVTGMRISELVHLRLADILFDTACVQVRGKGDKERMVPLPETMLADLAYYIREIRPQLLPKDHDRLVEHLFPTKYAGVIKPMTRQAFWIILQALWKKTGIKKHLSPHKLRHSLATHLLKNGTDLRSLQLLLGHERVTSVEIYTHVETTRLREEYDEKHPRSQ
jgi:integrase/recombinase XerD